MSDQREVVVVEHRADEDKPWHISLEGVGVLEKGRALLNHPGRDFSTREEAEEVAEKIRELLKSDAVEVRDGGGGGASETHEQTLGEAGISYDDTSVNDDDLTGSFAESVPAGTGSTDVDTPDASELSESAPVLAPAGYGDEIIVTPGESDWVDEVKEVEPPVADPDPEVATPPVALPVPPVEGAVPPEHREEWDEHAALVQEEELSETEDAYPGPGEQEEEVRRDNLM